MNYLQYFRLRAEPFGHAPAQDAYYASTAHTRVIDRLLWAVEGMRGLAVVSGDVGYGKTTIARRLMSLLTSENYHAVMVVMVHAGVKPDWLLAHIARQLGVESVDDNKLELISRIYVQLERLHAQGRKVVVLLDEAQMLTGRPMMEELRGLLNLEMPGRKLLSIVLFGLPDVFENIYLDKPLAQRLALRCVLKPFDEPETRAYLMHRLAVVGANRPIFEAPATRFIHQASGGVPRLINVIADNALLEMFFARDTSASFELLGRVCEDLGLEPPPNEPMPAQGTLPEVELGFCPDEIAANVASEPIPAALSNSLIQGGKKDIADPLAFLAGTPKKKDKNA
jgi:general secretion pathway protein A